VIARRLTVTGRVQGVGFRYFAVRAARDVGVVGWVRNLPDGSVETVAQGEPAAVDRYVEKLREGPPAGRVTQLRMEEVSTGGFDSFEITG